MQYNSESHITTVEEVQNFFHWLVFEVVGDDFHPDDRFEEYTEPEFTPEEVNLYNRLMDECFEVCEKEDVDIYDLGWTELEDWLKKN